MLDQFFNLQVTTALTVFPLAILVLSLAVYFNAQKFTCKPTRIWVRGITISRLARFVQGKHMWKYFLLLVCVVQGCVPIPPRVGIPQELSDEAQIPGIPEARYWGDDSAFADAWLAIPDAVIQDRYKEVYGSEHHYLAISGGGPDGAFGAGLLVGWSATGLRPQFAIVSGISTGALIAPFAFLGPDYDTQLKEIYTKYSTKDLVTKRGLLQGLTSDAMSDTALLRNLIAQYIDDEMVQAIGDEYRKGRELNIGTTNLDAKRSVIWDIGRIAASGMPKAKELIQDIMLASASIPVLFPPVMIEVEAKGKRYDEMHVDGGATSQMFFYPLGVDWTLVKEKLEIKGMPRVYMIRNSKLEPEWETIDRSVQPIAISSIESLIRTQGIGDMYRIYLDAMHDGLEYNLAHIPKNFNEQPKELFDQEYMKKLFDLGYEMAKQGYPWKTSPPGIEK